MFDSRKMLFSESYKISVLMSEYESVLLIVTNFNMIALLLYL